MIMIMITIMINMMAVVVMIKMAMKENMSVRWRIVVRTLHLLVMSNLCVNKK
jgi:hypothetical protein